MTVSDSAQPHDSSDADTALTMNDSVEPPAPIASAHQENDNQVDSMDKEKVSLVEL